MYDRYAEEVIRECANSGVVELGRLGKTLARWRVEIVNKHRTGDSNGPTEAVNLLIKKIKRAGCGFTNFAHYRLRVLAHCGITWETPRIARLRGPAPHSIAHQQVQFQAQTLQALTHLTSLTQTLLGTCTTLTELVRAQAEDSKLQTELLKRREERDVSADGQGSVRSGGGDEGSALGEGLGRQQKASLAMELLGNPGIADDIRGIASEFLKKLFQ